MDLAIALTDDSINITVKNFFDTYIKINYIIIFVNSISGFGYKSKVFVQQNTFFLVIINKLFRISIIKYVLKREKIARAFI
jgi:hypothetical protein